MARDECHYCENPAEHQCPTCGRLYCDEHGDDTCLRCESPESAMPGVWTYRGTLLALVAGVAVTVYLLVSPPEERQSPAAPRPTASATVTPTRPPGTATRAAGTPGTATGGTVAPTGTPTGGAPSPTQGPRTYTVQSGDVLSAIAQRFGTTVDAILAVNPGLQANTLTPGQVITLPGAP